MRQDRSRAPEFEQSHAPNTGDVATSGSRVSRRTGGGVPPKRRAHAPGRRRDRGVGLRRLGVAVYGIRNWEIAIRQERPGGEDCRVTASGGDAGLVLEAPEALSLRAAGKFRESLVIRRTAGGAG